MKQLSVYQTSPFDAIRQADEQGRESWSARSLQELLGYAQWRQFEDAIERAKIACTNSGHTLETNFASVRKVTEKGKHGSYTVTDYHLSRYACYLVAMNSDPRKEAVSQAQTYFALKTREAETHQEQLAQPTLARETKGVHTFFYQQYQVRVMMHEGASWWIAKDIYPILGLYNADRARLEDDEQEMRTVVTAGGPQSVACVNMAGLYHLILLSRKQDQAKAFRRWIIRDVLPMLETSGNTQEAPDQKSLLSGLFADAERLTKFIHHLQGIQATLYPDTRKLITRKA